jgi:mRNA-degrading endonuclease YafQ of YafQ-DinJ toxin-antitoxin module
MSNERLVLWLDNHKHPLLCTHPLKGAYTGYWSFNVTADIRALYRFDGQQLVMFVLIGSHGSLYG